MSKQIDPLISALDTLRCAAYPSVQQKERMLRRVQLASRQPNLERSRLYNLIAVYPWRFAFGVSIAQAVVFTLLFGEKYTRIFLQVIGG